MQKTSAALPIFGHDLVHYSADNIVVFFLVLFGIFSKSQKGASELTVRKIREND